MENYIYNVKIAARHLIHARVPADLTHEWELANEHFSDIKSISRFIKWFFNLKETDTDLGCAYMEAYFEHEDPDAWSRYEMVWSGFTGTGIEGEMATVIRERCKPLKDFVGFYAEIVRIPVHEKNWEPHGKHWPCTCS